MKLEVEGSRFLLLSLNMNASDALIQIIIDNFDATINSQNGMKQTHALALIFAQANCSDENNNDLNFID